MTRLCLFMICQVIIILLRTAWPGSASSVSVSPLSLSPSSRSADFLPAWLMGPFILDPTMSSAGLSIDQTKQEWQFRMLISVTAAVAALTKAIWPALQKMVKSTQRGYLSASRLFLPPCPNLTCWGERSIVQYWRCKLFCTLSTLYILGFVFTYEQWRDLLLDI